MGPIFATSTFGGDDNGVLLGEPGKDGCRQPRTERGAEAVLEHEPLVAPFDSDSLAIEVLQ
jgi:hypothetical protein